MPGWTSAVSINPLYLSLWCWAAGPLLELSARLLLDSLGANPQEEILRGLGRQTLVLLWLVLLVPVLQRTLWPGVLTARRMLGLWAFAYALLHFLVYTILELDLDARDLLQEIARRPFILVGLASLLSLLPLALTSTDRMMRRLKKRWQQIHYLIYPATALAIWHFYWQVKADVLEPLIYLCALILLLTWRIAHRQSSNSH